MPREYMPEFVDRIMGKERKPPTEAEIAAELNKLRGVPDFSAEKRSFNPIKFIRPDGKGGREVGERVFRVDLTAKELNNEVNLYLQQAEVLAEAEQPTRLSMDKVTRMLEELATYKIRDMDPTIAEAVKEKIRNRFAVRSMMALTKEVITGNAADQFLQTILTMGKLNTYQYLYQNGEYSDAIRWFTKELEKGDTKDPAGNDVDPNDPTRAGAFYRKNKAERATDRGTLLAEYDAYRTRVIFENKEIEERNKARDEGRDTTKKEFVKVVPQALSLEERALAFDLAVGGSEVYGMAAFYNGPRLKDGRLRDLAIVQEMFTHPDIYTYSDPKLKTTYKSFRIDTLKKKNEATDPDEEYTDPDTGEKREIWRIDLTENEFWRRRDQLQDNSLLLCKPNEIGQDIAIMGDFWSRDRIYRDIGFSKQRFDALNRGPEYMRTVLETRGLGAFAPLNFGFVRLSDTFVEPGEGTLHAGACLNAGGVGAEAKKIFGEFGSLLDKGEVLEHANERKQGNTREKYKVLEPYLKLNFAGMDGYFSGARAYEQSYNARTEMLKKALDYTDTAEARHHGILSWNSADKTDALYILYVNNLITRDNAQYLRRVERIHWWTNFVFGGKDELAELIKASRQLAKIISIDLADIGS